MSIKRVQPSFGAFVPQPRYPMDDSEYEAIPAGENPYLDDDIEQNLALGIGDSRSLAHRVSKLHKEHLPWRTARRILEKHGFHPTSKAFNEDFAPIQHPDGGFNTTQFFERLGY